MKNSIKSKSFIPAMSLERQWFDLWQTPWCEQGFKTFSNLKLAAHCFLILCLLAEVYSMAARSWRSLSRRMRSQYHTE